MFIYKKLILLLFAVISIVVGSVLILGLWGSDRYQQELTQQLHKGTADYIQAHLKEPLIDPQGQANLPLLKSVAMHAMMINPLVEIYLLDDRGRILGHALHTDDIIRKKVDLQPIKEYIARDKTPFIEGDNPRNRNQQVFSATAIYHQTNQELAGYLYVVLASEQLSQLSDNIASSYVLRLLFLVFSALMLILTIIGGYGFYRITQPLQKLQKRVQKIHSADSMQTITTSTPIDNQSEIDALSTAFTAMQQRIDEQFEDLKHTDRMRRELFSNISHDLRTPVASIQGYIETLLIKQGQLSSEDSKRYLAIALKNCQRLTQLISSLFELTKLDNKGIKPQPEVFSLPELVHDIAQQYELIANEKEISIAIDLEKTDIYVNADIRLIERVFQNLIDNALKFCSKGNTITIAISLQQDKVRTTVIDNGTGIEAHELPYLFDRYHQNQNQAPSNKAIGSGLGLAITKRILELHGSIIEVSSKLAEGTQFSFNLPSERAHLVS